MSSLLTKRLSHILDTLDLIGIHARDIAEDFQLVEMTSSGESVINTGQYLDFLTTVADKFDRPHLGYQLTSQWSILDYQLLGYLLKNAPDLGSSIQQFCNHASYILPSSRLCLEQTKTTATLKYSINGFSPQRCRYSIEMLISSIVNSFREYFQDDSWVPECAYFQHSVPEDTIPAEKYIGKNIKYNHFFNGVSFDRDLLSVKIPGADARIQNMIEPIIQSSLDSIDDNSSTLGLVAKELTTQLTHSRLPVLDDIAKKLGMSKSTLHRRLSESGTSYRQLRSDIIINLAKESLRTSTSQITTLALRFGYSDASSFNHFFQQQTGLTPSEYRKEAKAGNKT